MVTTNKNSFLSELERLLTFMCEEDRKTAITKFEKIFDDAPDEQTAAAILGSPTRQAVAMARVYDFKERERELRNDENGSDLFYDDSTPAFLETIDEIYKSIHTTEQNAPAENQNQVIQTDVDVTAEAQTQNKFDSSTINDSFETQVKESTDYAEICQEKPHAAVKTRRRPAWKDPIPDEISGTDYSNNSNFALEEKKEVKAVSAVSNASVDVDSFVSSMKVEDAISAAETSAIGTDSNDNDDSKLAEKTELVKTQNPLSELSEDDDEDKLPADEGKKHKKVHKKSVPLVILLTLLAIPLTALIIALLLVAAVTFLALAAFLLFISVTLISSAFGGFAVFADIMVVLGTALVLFAVGVLSLWTGIWLIGGAIVGVIKGAIRLIARISDREVTVNE